MKEEKTLTGTCGTENYNTYTCPKCGCTVYARETYDFYNNLFRYHASCANCDYEINTEREGTLNEVRKEAGLKPIKEVKADELLTKPEPKPDIPMCREVHAVLEERIKPEEQPCGYCGSLMEYKDVKFGEDLNHIVVLYKCPVCGRYCEKYRELDNYGVQVLDNGNVVNTIIEGKDANPDEPNMCQHALNKIIQFSCPNCPDDKGCLNCNIKDSCNALAKYYVDILQKSIDTEYIHKVNEIMRENEKLIESNRKLCERISELQDKLDNLQHSLQPSKEECTCCDDIDYKAEYHRLLGQSRGLIKEINHYRRIVCELVHLI